MKSTSLVLIIAAIIIIGGGAYWYSHMHSVAPVTATSTATATVTPASPNTPNVPASNSTAAPAAAVTVTTTAVTTSNTSSGIPVPTGVAPVENFTVNGNDQTADVMTINAKKGDVVHITFGADAGTTYHGGLDFRSSVVNTGTITPGSTKTITFTADQSFSFTPYWPATNIAKPYTIKVNVS